MVFFVLLTIIEHPKLKNKRFAGIFALLLFLAVVSSLGNYYATKYNFVPVALFCSSLASGSVIGLIIIPIAYFYEKYKIKRGNSNNEKNFERK